MTSKCVAFVDFIRCITLTFNTLRLGDSISPLSPALLRPKQMLLHNNY